MKRIVFRGSLMLGMLFAFSALPICAQQTTLEQLIKDTRASRIKAEQKVRKIKAKFASSTVQYKTAEDLYDDLSAEAQAISETIALSIREGKKPKDLDSFLRDLDAKSTKFVTYANEQLNTTGSIGIPAILIGVKYFWEMYSSNKSKKRAEEAQKIVELMAFPAWQDIAAATSK